MKSMPYVVLLSASFVVAGCGPSARATGGGDDSSPTADAGPVGPGSGSGSSSTCVVTGPENTPAECSDGVDNNCNGLIDCDDPSCSGIGNCPVCGQVQHPLSTPLALPDGVGDTACSTDANCPAGQHCFSIPGNDDGNPKECRASYISTLNFTAFGPTQKLVAVSNIQSVCVTIDHTWMRDLQIDLVAPSGQSIALDQFAGQTGGDVFLGQGNDDADDGTPGVGSDYCWTPTATNADWIDYANSNAPMNMINSVAFGSVDSLPAGNYKASAAWTGLIGATLNGGWELRVTDLWPLNYGYIFKWSIAFDPSIVTNCSGPVIQ